MQSKSEATVGNQLEGRRIALIGGAGFIGHNLAIALKRLGADVHIVDSLAVNNFYTLKKQEEEKPELAFYLEIVRQRLDLLKRHGVPLVEIDARDYHAMSRNLADIDPDTIVQLAAVAHANVSNKDPYSTFDHSLRTLENALDVARQPNLGVEHFIYFSSSMVYGHFNGRAVTEDMVCEPLGIYGALKFAGEKLVIGYNQVFDLPYTIIRPSALYGERCISRRVGQVFIENALRGRELNVSGDGSDRLDFTYIGDLVNGIVGCLTHETAKNEIFNITYGSSRSIADMIDILGEHFDDLRIRYTPKDRLMPDRGTLSVDKAKSLIGYDPAYPLETGFVHYIDWYKTNCRNIRELAAVA